MPRKRPTGAIVPIPYETRKKLRDGRTRVYKGYHARVDGKWVSAKTHRECAEKIRKRLRERSEWGIGTDRTVTLGTYVARWYEAKVHDIDPSTASGYGAVINVHLEPYRNVRLADVTPSMARRWVQNMSVNGRPASLTYRQTMYNVLQQVFAAAVADRLIPTNPIAGFKPRNKDVRLGTADTERTSFTDAQMRAMLAAATGDIMDGARQWWRLLTGMRQTEILGATMDDLHLERRTMGDGTELWVGEYTVNWKLEGVRKRHGCGERGADGRYPCGYRMAAKCPRWAWRVPDGFDMIPLEGRFCLTAPKSKRGRPMPVIPQLGAVMRRYLEATRDVPNPYGLVFRNRDGSPIDPVDDLASFRRLMERAGIPDPERRYGHECRHSVVSLLFSMGVDPGVIQRVIGHSSLAMSEHYRHVPWDELLDGMERIGDRLDLKRIEWK